MHGNQSGKEVLALELGNQLVTFCWACDTFNEANGSTKVVPKSHLKRRHPTQQETQDEPGGGLAAPTMPNVQCPVLMFHGLEDTALLSGASPALGTGSTPISPW